MDNIKYLNKWENYIGPSIIKTTNTFGGYN